MTVRLPIGHAVMRLCGYADMRLYGYVARRCATIGYSGFEVYGEAQIIAVDCCFHILYR